MRYLVIVFAGFFASLAGYSQILNDSQRELLGKSYPLAKQAVKMNPPSEAFKATPHQLSDDPVFQQIVNKVDWPSINASAADLMALEFNSEELQALIEFWGSPIGRKIDRKMANYQNKVGQLIQATLQDLVQKELKSGNIKSVPGTGGRPLPGGMNMKRNAIPEDVLRGLQ